MDKYLYYTERKQKQSVLQSLAVQKLQYKYKYSTRTCVPVQYFHILHIVVVRVLVRTGGIRVLVRTYRYRYRKYSSTVQRQCLYVLYTSTVYSNFDVLVRIYRYVLCPYEYMYLYTYWYL